MSNRGNSSNSDANGEEEGWGSKLFKFASAAAATAAVAGGLYAVLTSSASERPEVPFQQQTQARGLRNDQFEDPDDDEVDFNHHRNDVVVTTYERWLFPLDNGWVKCNVDASGARQTGGFSGCGVVFRDACGSWLYGYAKSLDDTLSSTVELEAILFGLEKAKELGHHKLILESDFLPGVDVINKKDDARSRTSGEKELVQEIMGLVTRDVKVTHILHKDNLVAHKLARGARNLHFGMVRTVTERELLNNSPFNNSRYA